MFSGSAATPPVMAASRQGSNTHSLAGSQMPSGHASPIPPSMVWSPLLGCIFTPSRAHHLPLHDVGTPLKIVQKPDSRFALLLTRSQDPAADPRRMRRIIAEVSTSSFLCSSFLEYLARWFALRCDWWSMTLTWSYRSLVQDPRWNQSAVPTLLQLCFNALVASYEREHSPGGRFYGNSLLAQLSPEVRVSICVVGTLC